MAISNFMSAGRNALIVRVTSYRDQCPKGSLSGSCLDKPVRFNSLAQLLMMMEALMDRENQPQRGEEPRSFGQQDLFQRTAPAQGGEKPVAAFQISVLFRQNASWQGTLVWLDRKLDAQFRSVLELIRLMDSALSAGVE